MEASPKPVTVSSPGYVTDSGPGPVPESGPLLASVHGLGLCGDICPEPLDLLACGSAWQSQLRCPARAAPQTPA